MEGKAGEVWPFLESSRLEEPPVRYPVAAVFHGHAHGGSPEGRPRADAPVYNVALPLLQRAFPGGPGFRTTELPSRE